MSLSNCTPLFDWNVKSDVKVSVSSSSGNNVPLLPCVLFQTDCTVGRERAKNINRKFMLPSSCQSRYKNTKKFRDNDPQVILSRPQSRNSKHGCVFAVLEQKSTGDCKTRHSWFYRVPLSILQNYFGSIFTILSYYIWANEENIKRAESHYGSQSAHLTSRLIPVALAR